MNEKLGFLSSIRFWKLFAIAVVQFLAAQGVIAQDLATPITIWLGGSVAIKTIDKFSE